MARDPFGQPIITRTPFADNLRNRYGGGGGSLTSPGFYPGGSATQNPGLLPGSPPANRTGGTPSGMWNGGMANPGERYDGSPQVRDAGQYTGFNQGTAPVNRTATRPAPLPGTYGDFGAQTMQPYQPPRRAMPDYGAGVTMSPVGGGPLNNLTPRFDPTQDNPWGRSGNLNTGLHGLLAQLLGRGGRF